MTRIIPERLSRVLLTEVCELWMTPTSQQILIRFAELPHWAEDALAYIDVKSDTLCIQEETRGGGTEKTHSTVN